MPPEELYPTMSDPHAIDAPDHGDDHGHDDHAHAETALGPIDVAAWGAGVAGIAIALAIAACFALATSTLT
jgi:hypothetical protein